MGKSSFKKPNMKYTEMAIYIDNTIYKENITEQELYTCYQYIYHLFFMFAHKGKYFPNNDYYDDFALYATQDVYLRLTNKKQFGEHPTLDKVTSVLNYIKSCIYGLKVEYQQKYYNQIINNDDKINTDILENNIKENIQEQYNPLLYEAMIHEIKTLPEICKKVIYDSPYRNNKLLMKNIYISCLLTLLSSLTLNNENKIKLQNKIDKGYNVNSLINKLYKEEKESSVILWNIPTSMSSYILVLCNKIKSQFSKELISTKNYFKLDDDVMTQIMMSGYDNLKDSSKGDNYDE